MKATCFTNIITIFEFFISTKLPICTPLAINVPGRSRPYGPTWQSFPTVELSINENELIWVPFPISQFLCMFSKAYVEAFLNEVPNSWYELLSGILASSIFDDTSRLIWMVLKTTLEVVDGRSRLVAYKTLAKIKTSRELSIRRSEK